MTAGGTSIPEVQALLRALAAGRDVAELGSAFGEGAAAMAETARSVVTVEEIVDVLDPRPGAVVLPSWAVSYVAAAPGGAHPSYALGYSVRDNDFYVGWDAISRDRAAFTAWLDEHVYEAGGTR